MNDVYITKISTDLILAPESDFLGLVELTPSWIILNVFHEPTNQSPRNSVEPVDPY